MTKKDYELDLLGFDDFLLCEELHSLSIELLTFHAREYFKLTQGSLKIGKGLHYQKMLAYAELRREMVSYSDERKRELLVKLREEWGLIDWNSSKCKYPDLIQ